PGWDPTGTPPPSGETPTTAGRAQTRPRAAAPPACRAPRTPTARAVDVLPPPAPLDAVGGTGDGLGPTRRSGWDPTGTPPPSGETATTAPGAQRRTWAAPPPACRAPRTPTARAVDVLPPPAPHDAGGGTGDGLGRTR
ncbi:Synaptojanin-1, partial [Manis javanica]